VTTNPRSAYIHIPFCASKCWYCDFNSYCGLESLFDAYVSALTKEIHSAQRSLTNELQSVYFGGGTPTVLPTRDLCSILKELKEVIGVSDDAEITVEANPGTVDFASLGELRKAGFNRLSLGVQSLDDSFLRSIGRTHTRDQALNAYKTARQVGFANVSVDLIFALPGQNPTDWTRALDGFLQLDPAAEHVSLYELSIEEGTRFAQMNAQGVIAPVDEDMRLEMYESAIARLAEAGYEHYEVSNFALPGYRSRHNTTYWLNESYYGFGAGATSYLERKRSRRISNPSKYIDAINAGSDAIEFSERLQGRAMLGETIIQGLRMLEGVDLSRLQAQTGLHPMSEFSTQVESLKRRGLIELVGDRLRTTHAGLLLLNDVSGEFVTVP
jgi:oxygen-independent coproporphyrinogen-3 oxidase